MKSMKKMLAAVMVLVVALAGVFVVIGGDNADAATTNANVLTGTEITAAGAYYVAESKNITIGYQILSSNDVTIFAKAGVVINVVVKEGTTTATGNLIIKSVKEQTVSSASVTIDDSDIIADSTVSFSSLAQNNNISYTSSSNTATAKVMVSGTVGGNVTGTNNGVTVGTSLVTVGSVSNVTYGFKVVKDTTTYYNVGKDLSSLALSGTNSIEVRNGSVDLTLNYDDKTGTTAVTKSTKVSFDSVVSTSGITISLTNNSSEANIPTIAGTWSSGEISVSSGIIKKSGNASVGNLNAYADKTYATEGAILAASISDLTITDLYVYGSVASNESVGIKNTKTVNFVSSEVTSLTINGLDASSNIIKSWIVSAEGSGQLTITVSGDNSRVALSTIPAGIGLVSGKFTTNASTIDETKSIIISTGATLETSSTTIALKGSVLLYGTIDSIANSGGTTTTTITVSKQDGSEPGQFRAFSGAVIMDDIIIAQGTDGIIDITGAMVEQTVTGNNSTNVIYPQSQKVVVSDYYDVTKNSTVTIHGSFEIPAGAVVTIKSGSSIIVDGSTSEVIIDGKLIVEEGATFNVQSSKSVMISGLVESDTGSSTSYSGTVTVKTGGKVESGGSFAGTTLAIDSGAVVELSGSTNGAVVITNKGTVITNGVLLKNNLTVRMASAGAEVDIVSFSIETSASYSFIVSDQNMVVKVGQTAPEAYNYITLNALANNTGLSGITITESIVKVSDGLVKKMDISGSIETYIPSSASITAGTAITINGTGVSIDDSVYLGEKLWLLVNTDAVLSIAGQLNALESDTKITATGTIDISGEIVVKSNTPISTASNVNSAYFKEKDDKGATIQHYTTLKNAIDSGVTSIDVNGVIVVDNSIDVPAGVIISNNATSLTIGSDESRDVIVKVADGATFKGNGVVVKGTLEFDNKKNNRLASISSDVSVIGDVSSKYTNLYSALAGSVAGDTVTVTSENKVIVNADLTVKEGVTLVIPAGKSIKVQKNVAVVIDGKVIASSGFESENGFDVKKSVDKASMTVNGIFMTGETGVPSAIYNVYKIAGAYYAIADSLGSYTYIAPLSIAAADVQKTDIVYIYGENKVGSVEIIGTETDSAQIQVVNTAVLNADLVISYAIITVADGGRFDGTIASVVGGITFVNSDNFVVTAGVQNDIEKIVISGTPGKASNVAGSPDQKVTIGNGVVTSAGTSTNKFDLSGTSASISEGATLSVNGYAKAKDLPVAGKLIVNNDSDLDVSGYLQITGELEVAEAIVEKSKLAGVIHVDTIYVGLTKTAVGSMTAGSIAVISAPAVDGLNTIIIGAGSTVSSEILEPLVKKTVYTIEGSEYLTIFTKVDVTINSVLKPSVEGAQITGWEYIKSGVTKSVTTEKVGSVSSVAATMDYKVYTMTFLVDSGISDIYVDGVLVASEGLSTSGYTEPVKIAAGSHQITYKLKSGFGGNITITLNGDKIADGKFTITKDMDFSKTVYKVVISGVEVVDPVTPTPEPTPVEPTKDDSMGITEYLLIVLVVLAAILVVVVAIRMMRS